MTVEVAGSMSRRGTGNSELKSHGSYLPNHITVNLKWRNRTAHCNPPTHVGRQHMHTSREDDRLWLCTEDISVVPFVQPAQGRHIVLLFCLASLVRRGVFLAATEEDLGFWRGYTVQSLKQYKVNPKWAPGRSSVWCKAMQSWNWALLWLNIGYDSIKQTVGIYVWVMHTPWNNQHNLSYSAQLEYLPLIQPNTFHPLYFRGK